ncbi:hypothetical protein, partial [Salmonella enterica]|uniref:hypothetical protein n=1 Tax=Salmonella enterica TaxID=28901 RepID=UPI0032988212
YVPAAPDPGTSAFLSSSIYFPFSIAKSSASWEISNSETVAVQAEWPSVSVITKPDPIVLSQDTCRI